MSRIVKTVGIFSIVFSSAGWGSNDQMMQVLVYCPSVYEVMAPHDKTHYRNSYNTLHTLFTIEAAMAGVPINYYIKKNMDGTGRGDIENLEDFVDAVTDKIRSELSDGLVSRSQLEEVMEICPLFWE